MKKLLCLFMVILTAFSAVTVFAADSDVSMTSGVRLSYDGVYYGEFLSGEGTINVNLKNKGDAGSVTFVVAEYSENNGYKTLVQNKIQTLNIEKDTEKTFEIKFTPSDVNNSFNVFAFRNSNVGSVYLGNEFVLDKYQYIGNEDNGTSVYKINSFTDFVYDKFRYVSTEEDGTTVYKVDRFAN